MAANNGAAGAESERLTRNRVDPRDASRSLLRATSLNATALAVQVALRAVTLVILAAALGPAGQGEVALGYLVSMIGISIGSLGLDVALMRSPSAKDGDEAGRAAVWIQSVVVTVVAAIGLAVVTAVSLPVAVAFGLIAVPPLVFTRLSASSALGHGRDRTFAALTVAPWAVNALAVIALAAVYELTPRRALVAFAVASAASAALSARALAPWLRAGARAALWRSDVYRTGLAIYPGMLAQLANYRLDQVVIAAVLPRADLGIYSIAVAGSEVGTLPAQATANAILPRASRAEPERRIRYTAVVGVAAAGLAIAIPFVLAIELALPRYERALVPFLLLLPGTVALAASKVLAATATGWGAPWQASRVALTPLVVTIVGTSTLIPVLGIAGAAVASSVAYTASAGLLLLAVRRLEGRHHGPRDVELATPPAPDRA